MADEREVSIKEDLLRQYQQGESKLVVLREQFKNLADRYGNLASLLRDEPELFEPDLDVMYGELQIFAGMAKDYRDLLIKNAERKKTLIKMNVL